MVVRVLLGIVSAVMFRNDVDMLLIGRLESLSVRVIFDILADA